jgi:hypothetical protein
MGRYSQLVAVNIEHQYFAHNLGPSLQFVPTPDTASLIYRSDLVVKNTPRRLNVFLDEDRLEALRMETTRPQDPAFLTFKAFTADQAFKNYTEPGVLRDDFTLVFENGDGAQSPENAPVPLHAGEFAGDADFRSHKTIAESPGLWSNQDLVRRPDFIIRIKLDGQDFASGAPGIGRTYAIRFQARRTIWKYYVLGKFKKEPGITDVRNQTEFEFTGKASLPGERTALTYRSKTPIPLREQHDVRFQLRDRNVSGGKVLIRRLPVASANQFGKELIDGRETIVSEIYINC